MPSSRRVPLSSRGAGIGGSGSDPQLIGKRVRARLEEHSYRKWFFATIVGTMSSGGPETVPWLLLKVDRAVSRQIGESQILFRPEHAGFADRAGSHVGRALKQGAVVRYRPSTEDLLLNPDSELAFLEGRVGVVATRNDASAANASGGIRIIARGRIAPP